MFLEIADKRFHILFCLCLRLFHVFDQPFLLSPNIGCGFWVELDLLNIFVDLSEEDLVPSCIELAFLIVYGIDRKFDTEAVWEFNLVLLVLINIFYI